MEKQRDQQTRTESKTRAVVRVNLCLSSGDYSRALDLLRGTAAEFPNDRELSDLEKFAQDGAKRKAEADRLITESQELFAQRKSAGAIQLLRQAYEVDKNNSLARTILANALVEHAYSIVETDWWEAETLANEALALNPTHPTAKTINSLILERKMAGSVEEWVAQTSKLQASGNLSAALSQIAEGFTVYPHEPRLLQIQDAIQRDHSTARRQARRRDLEDLRRTASEVDTVADAAPRKALAERIKAVTVKYSTDGEILSIANALLLRLGQTGVRQKSSTESPDSEGMAPINHRPLPIAPEVLRAAASHVPPNWIPPENTRKAKVPAGKAPATEVLPSVVLPSVVLPSVVLPSITLPSESQPSIVPSGNVPRDKVSTSSPEQLHSPLPLQTTAPALTAEPSVSEAKVTSPLPPLALPRSNSTRMILVSAAAIIAVAAISYFAGTHHASPVAKTPAVTPGVSAPIVSAPDLSAPVSVSVPEQPTPEPSPSALAPSSDTTAKVTVADQPAAASTPSLGALLVIVGQDDARVFLNGKPQRQTTQAGQLRLPNLELENYVVQVAKPGFQDPPQQKVRIRQGEQAKLIFKLQPNPEPQARLASLTIQGGDPGTTVLVDQSVIGTIQPDGALSVSTLNPGDHTIELRKERSKPRQFKKHFVAGTAVTLAAADAALEALPGELKITFAPPDASIAIVKGDLLKMVSSGVPLNLAPGSYTLTARTSDRFTRSSTLEVVAGQSKTLDLSLAPNGMSKWDDPSAWKHEGDAFIRRGGDFVLYGVVPASGTFVFSAMPAKGHLLQWVLNYSDPKNYVLFQMDDNNFYRTVIRNGEKRDQIAVPDKGDKKSFRTLQIRVSPTEIVHQIKHGDRWTILDRWTQPGANPGQGKFGFYLPGNDQVEVSSFAHYGELNIR